jgi:hypothetical protein
MPGFSPVIWQAASRLQLPHLPAFSIFNLDFTRRDPHHWTPSCPKFPERLHGGGAKIGWPLVRVCWFSSRPFSHSQVWTPLVG